MSTAVVNAIFVAYERLDDMAGSIAMSRAMDVVEVRLQGGSEELAAAVEQLRHQLVVQIREAQTALSDARLLIQRGEVAE